MRIAGCAVGVGVARAAAGGGGLGEGGGGGRGGEGGAGGGGGGGGGGGSGGCGGDGGGGGEDGHWMLFPALPLRLRVGARVLPCSVAQCDLRTALEVVPDCLVGEEVDIAGVELDARLGPHRHALVEPLQLEGHAIRSWSEPRPRDQLALCVTMPSDATLICVEVVVQFADQRRRGVHQTRQLRTQPGGVRVVLEVDDGAATSRNVGGLVEVAHAVVVPCVLVYHTAVGERGRVLRHRTQLGEDGLAIAEQNTNATLHHQDRRLGSGEARPIEEWVQRDELGCGTELARDEVQLSDAEAVGGRGADHLHPVLVFGAVAKRNGEGLVPHASRLRRLPRWRDARCQQHSRLRRGRDRLHWCRRRL
mmetsp:Transcript_14120/g.41903  ORF Transcript_14120/g.41903 Transcript_14120/m.41903 type:complete len:363 (+) Transcript_14120:2626-3714(+)